MAKIVIASHNIRSRALRDLAARLSQKVGYRVYRVHPANVRRRVPIWFNPGVDKVAQFRAFRDRQVSAPGYVLSAGDVNNLPGSQVVARQLTNASEGRGIIIFNKGDPVPRAPLYTEYIPKKYEYRVHVFNNQVIDVAVKRKKRGYPEDRNTQIRNTANGYVFCRDGLTEPAGLRQLAIDAVRALNRTQGAVDIVHNEKKNQCYVLEVNSRPGMMGTTLENYANAIVRAI